MDTSQRIVRLCDGDNRLIFQGLGDSVTIKALQIEYLWIEVVVALKDLFTPAIERADDAFREICELLSEVPISKAPTLQLQKDWHRYKQTSCNNYHKMHDMPLRRRMRCRWRPRESRRTLWGLSSDTVVLDEYAFSEESLVEKVESGGGA